MLKRRGALQAVGLGLAALGSTLAFADAAASPMGPTLLPYGAESLKILMQRLGKMPRRRDFKSVPMILNDESQWDAAALRELMAYRAAPKQVWDNTDLGGPWLNGMRNALNAQIWSFKHPDFLIASATHGAANLALYDQATWDKYQLGKLAGSTLRTNRWIEVATASSADPKDYQDPKGIFSLEDNCIPVLMRRGVVFTSCHNAIWEQAAKLIETNMNPDKLTLDALAADLTNHLIDGVILTPGAVAVIPELQRVGFHYLR